MKKGSLLVLLILGLCFQTALAQFGQGSSEIKLKPVTKTFALTKVQIIPRPGETIDNGIIIIKDGLIHAVGTNIDIPNDAKIIEADSMVAYAGFIDGLSHTGIPKPKPDNNRQRVEDPGNPPNDIAGVQPERSATDMLDPSDNSVKDMRQLGFTTVHVAPRGSMLPGSGAIINLDGEKATDMVVMAPSSFFSQLSSAPGVFPATIIGVMSKYRDLYKQAEQSKAYSEAYAMNPAGKKRPERDPVMEAFYPVIDGSLPNFFNVSEVKSIYRVMTLQRDLGFPLVLANVKEGWHVMDDIKANQIPVFLSLELPKEVKKKEDKKKEDEKEEMSEEMKMFEQKRAEAMEKAVSQAAAFEKAGITFGFSAASVSTRNFKKNLKRMMDAGLSETTALAALTTTPAKMLGLDAVMGTVEKGKMANLVITDGPYFEEDSNVKYVFVDGNLYEYEARKKRKAGATDAEMLKLAVGKWNVNIAVPGQPTDATMEITNEGGVLSGKITTPQRSDGDEMQDIAFDGKTLLFTVPFAIQGQQLILEYELNIDGDSITGDVTVGDFGSFDVRGSRSPE